jgi:lipoyl(octanoyl) transferase
MVDTFIKHSSSLDTEISWLGRGLPYDAGLRAQDEAAGQVRGALSIDPECRKSHAIVLGLEHSPVVTLGKRGAAEADLRVAPDEIIARGVALQVAHRGGQATLHSPGQLVIYPIVPIRELGIGIRDFVNLLEQTTIDFLASKGIEARRACCEPGLYTSQGKIAFFGLRVSQGVTSHGISLNVSNDVSLFSLIRSCGVENENFDRMVDHGVTDATEEVFRQWAERFDRQLQTLTVT